MQVKCTKVLAKELNRRFKRRDGFGGYFATVEKAWDFWEGEKQVIRVYYPENYYACPRDIDNSDLMRVYKDSDKTFDGFFDTLLDSVEV